MNIFYVYIYLDTRKPGVFSYITTIETLTFTHEPIYIGKGKGRRKNVHMQATKANGKHPLYDKIRKIKASGLLPKIVTIKEDLSELESLKLEKEIIEVIGRVNLNNGPLLNIIEGGTKNPVLSGDQAPMHGKSLYRVWKEKYGEEEANNKLLLYRAKMSSVKKGKKLSESAKCNISAGAKQRWNGIPKQDRKKMLSHLIASCTNEDKIHNLSKRMTEMNKMNNGSKNPRAKKVHANGIVYFTVKEAAKTHNITHGCVRHRCLSDNFPNWFYHNNYKG